MTEIFNNLIYEPLLSVLVFIYNNIAFGDLGLAIIILTVLIRVVLFPIFWKSEKDKLLMARLQPYIKKIQLDHKGNREEQAKRLIALYREHRLNPFSGFLLILLQLPVLIAIYQIFLREITVEVFNNIAFLNLVDLSKRSLVFAVLAAALQYFQSKLALPQERNISSQFAGIGRIMVVVGPVITFAVLVNFPAALSLYWTTSILFSLGQQIIINKKLPKKEYDGNSPKNRNPA